MAALVGNWKIRRSLSSAAVKSYCSLLGACVIAVALSVDPMVCRTDVSAYYHAGVAFVVVVPFHAGPSDGAG